MILNKTIVIEIFPGGKIMKNKFIVVVPSNIQKLNMGFATFNLTEKFVCEAMTVLDVYRQYPHAIIVKQLKTDVNENDNSVK